MCVIAAVFCVMTQYVTMCVIAMVSVSQSGVLRSVVQLLYCYDTFVSQCVVCYNCWMSWRVCIMTWCIKMCVTTVVLLQCVLHHSHDVCYNKVVLSPGVLYHSMMCCNPTYLLLCLSVTTVVLSLSHIVGKYMPQSVNASTRPVARILGGVVLFQEKVDLFLKLKII